MMTLNTKNESLKIAAPYYGTLNHPTRGMSNLYFLVDIDCCKRKIENMHLSVWNPVEEHRLGNWLSKMGVKTLVCNTADGCHEQELADSGVQIHRIDRADILSGIRSWLSGTTPLPA